nr:translation initiation factor IF-2 [Oryctolagus cuniculus]
MLAALDRARRAARGGAGRGRAEGGRGAGAGAAGGPRACLGGPRAAARGDGARVLASVRRGRLRAGAAGRATGAIAGAAAPARLVPAGSCARPSDVNGGNGAAAAASAARGRSRRARAGTGWGRPRPDGRGGPWGGGRGGRAPTGQTRPARNVGEWAGAAGAGRVTSRQPRPRRCPGGSRGRRGRGGCGDGRVVTVGPGPGLGSWGGAGPRRGTPDAPAWASGARRQCDVLELRLCPAAPGRGPWLRGWGRAPRLASAPRNRTPLRSPDNKASPPPQSFPAAPPPTSRPGPRTPDPAPAQDWTLRDEPQFADANLDASERPPGPPGSFLTPARPRGGPPAGLDEDGDRSCREEEWSTQRHRLGRTLDLPGELHSGGVQSSGELSCGLCMVVTSTWHLGRRSKYKEIMMGQEIPYQESQTPILNSFDVE